MGTYHRGPNGSPNGKAPAKVVDPYAKFNDNLPRKPAFEWEIATSSLQYLSAMPPAALADAFFVMEMTVATCPIASLRRELNNVIKIWAAKLPGEAIPWERDLPTVDLFAHIDMGDGSQN